MPKSTDKKHAQLKPRWRILFKQEIAMGPGKIDLLEAIGKCGSISAAARDMGISYRRAWVLVDTMNRCFRKPVVTCATGGKGGGGAGLSEFGRRLAEIYRGMETKSIKAVERDWKTILSEYLRDA